MMSSPVDFVVWGYKNIGKDVNRWSTNSDDLFIVMKACVEPFEWADNRRMVHQRATNSSEQHFSDFD